MSGRRSVRKRDSVRRKFRGEMTNISSEVGHEASVSQFSRLNEYSMENVGHCEMCYT